MMAEQLGCAVWCLRVPLMGAILVCLVRLLTERGFNVRQ